MQGPSLFLAQVAPNLALYKQNHFCLFVCFKTEELLLLGVKKTNKQKKLFLDLKLFAAYFLEKDICLKRNGEQWRWSNGEWPIHLESLLSLASLKPLQPHHISCLLSYLLLVFSFHFLESLISDSLLVHFVPLGILPFLKFL